MLFTDSLFITTDDLRKIESEVVTVATSNKVTLADHIPTSVNETADWLLSRNVTFSGYQPTWNNGGQAMLNSLAQASNRTRFALSQVVITNPLYPAADSDLKRLAVYRCLSSFYRQVASRKEEDRYEKKFESYRWEAEWVYLPPFMRRGIPICYRPLNAPAAYLEPNSGTWGAANISRALSTSTVDGDPTIRVTITYVDSSFYSSPTRNQNAESDSPAAASLQMHAGDHIIVDITSLNPPDGTVRPQLVSTFSPNNLRATHWNVYASVGSGPAYLQNSSPIAIATKTFAMSATPLTAGTVLGYGQWADIFLPFGERLFSRV